MLQYLKSALDFIQLVSLIPSNYNHEHLWFPKHVPLVPNKILWGLRLHAKDHWEIFLT